MKRFALSVVMALMVLYSVHAFVPQVTREALSSRTVAQESKATALEPTSAAKSETSKAASPQNKTQASNASSDEAVNPSIAIEAKLSLPRNFEFPDVPIQDAVDKLSETLGIPIIIDKKALEDAGVGTDKTVNINLRGFRTDKFFDLMLDELELTWITRDGYVFITTKEKLSLLLEVRVYNCSDLIELVKRKPKLAAEKMGRGGLGGLVGGLGGQAAGAPAAGIPGAGAAGPAAPAGVPVGFPGFPGAEAANADATSSPELVPDNESLIDLIKTTLDPDSWDDLGGSGSIAAYHGGLLVVNQNGQIHRRIELLLKMMRQAKQAEPGTVLRER